MREKNINSIASCIKLSQFTTMNVIDGQAGFIFYSSLIFYSLTIDNILNIIVLLILAGLTIATLTGDNGLLTKAGNAKNTSEKGEIEEQVKLAYNEWKLRKETGETVDLQNTVQTTLDKMYDNATVNKQGKAISINVKGYEFTLIDDGTMEEGKLAYLDIAEGNIDIYSNGYKQYTGNLQSLNKNGVTECTGKYILTGTTTENVVRVCDEGKFKITIKNLNIDATQKSTTPFSASGKNTNTFVTLSISDKNVLKAGGDSAGLQFQNAELIENNGSTLTINGNGSLEAYGHRIWSRNWGLLSKFWK